MKGNKPKVAFFDFCETIVDFQTADAFVDYVREKRQSGVMEKKELVRKYLLKTKIIRFLEILIGSSFSINKRMKLNQLKGISENEVKKYAIDYYQEIVKPRFIPAIISRLSKLQAEGWSVVLVSGGYDVYLNEFAREFGIVKVISSIIGFDRGICTGRMKGLDCLRSNKIVLLQQFYAKEEIKSVSFSDSSSDIPLLSWTNKGYVVSHLKHQDWVDKFNFKEIIW